MTAGFEDEIVYELTHTGNGRPADVWTLRVGDGKATATQARGQSSSVLVRMPLPDFARIICGELHPAAAVMEGEIELEGDLRVAARLGEMFGGASPY